MISDVLSESCAEIRKYQNEMPDVYKEDAEEIDNVVAAMEKLRIKLDTAPEFPNNRKAGEK